MTVVPGAVAWEVEDVVDGGSASSLMGHSVTNPRSGSVCSVCRLRKVTIIHFMENSQFECCPECIRHTDEKSELKEKRMFKRAGAYTVRCTCKRPAAVRKQFAVRRFSVYTSSNASAVSPASPLGGLTVELDHLAPRFEVPASEITILESPTAFYETLKVSNCKITKGGA